MPSPVDAAAAAGAGAVAGGVVDDPWTVVVVADPNSPTAELHS